jgi:hypothetical protein
MATAKDIGSKYGSSISDFATASANVIEDLLIKHCNDGIELMRKRIWAKTKTGTASTLAQGLNITPKRTPKTITVLTMSRVNTIGNSPNYYDFVDKGVRGVKYNKAPQSKYKFKNLGTPPAMINSFKKWVASAGIKNVDTTKTSFKGKKRQTALSEQEKVAKTLAVRTKIGGIKPVNFIAQANNTIRNNELRKQLIEGLGVTIRINIKKDINGNNNQ